MGGKDQPLWMLTKNRKISVKSLYSFLINDGVRFPHKFLWKIKVPAKIKMFLWLFTRRSILIKDNLIKKGLKGGKECVYCWQEQNINHLFFECSAARLVWGLIKCALDLRTTPINLNDYLGRWLKTFKKPEKKLVLLGSPAIFRALWKYKNDIIFRSRKIYDLERYIIRIMCN